MRETIREPSSLTIRRTTAPPATDFANSERSRRGRSRGAGAIAFVSLFHDLSPVTSLLIAERFS